MYTIADKWSIITQISYYDANFMYIVHVFVCVCVHVCMFEGCKCCWLMPMLLAPTRHFEACPYISRSTHKHAGWLKAVVVVFVIVIVMLALAV